MSAIIDLLKKKYPTRRKNQDLVKQDEYNSATQELLAETYLRSSGNLKSEQSQSKPKTEIRIAQPGLIAAIVALILCGTIIYILASHALKVDITVVKSANSPYEDLLNTQKLDFLRGVKSKWGHIALTNSGGQESASIAINTKDNLDLSKKSLSIGVSPKKGGGDIRIILRDKNHRSYISDAFYIQDTKEGRQNFIITGDKPKESIDIQRIQQIRIEFENSSKQNKESSVILLDQVLLLTNN
jgi:hypothetical protein